MWPVFVKHLLIRTSALGLRYSVAEYCAPVWRNSAHNTMRTITGAVRCTRTKWLPVLSNIAPADIRREVATSRMILRARVKPELPLLTDIDFHPRPRLKSRRPIWFNLPDKAPTIQHLWRTRWLIVDVPNKSLINDPTIQLPGMDLPRGQWSRLNRFRSDAGPCGNGMHEWGYIASPLCDCSEYQTMRHIVNECPLTSFDDGISELHQAHDAAFNWQRRQLKDVIETRPTLNTQSVTDTEADPGTDKAAKTRLQHAADKRKRGQLQTPEEADDRRYRHSVCTPTQHADKRKRGQLQTPEEADDRRYRHSVCTPTQHADKRKRGQLQTPEEADDRRYRHSVCTPTQHADKRKLGQLQTPEEADDRRYRHSVCTPTQHADKRKLGQLQTPEEADDRRYRHSVCTPTQHADKRKLGQLQTPEEADDRRYRHSVCTPTQHADKRKLGQLQTPEEADDRRYRHSVYTPTQHADKRKLGQLQTPEEADDRRYRHSVCTPTQHAFNTQPTIESLDSCREGHWHSHSKNPDNNNVACLC